MLLSGRRHLVGVFVEEKPVAGGGAEEQRVEKPSEVMKV